MIESPSNVVRRRGILRGPAVLFPFHGGLPRMILLQSRILPGAMIAMSLVFGLMRCSLANAQEAVSVTEVTPEVLVFATTAGNVVTSVGPDGALLVGTP